jgi:hypothetical protein
MCDRPPSFQRTRSHFNPTYGRAIALENPESDRPSSFPVIALSYRDRTTQPQTLKAKQHSQLYLRATNRSTSQVKSFAISATTLVN